MDPQSLNKQRTGNNSSPATIWGRPKIKEKPLFNTY